ncbi:MAG TPA: DUF1294 domain-containing protein [Candidatus Thermoplasmatota archaeon]|nr:DUF1294 domain-containing protein [Candidatus Thermoplasmatota archaeon]
MDLLTGLVLGASAVAFVAMGVDKGLAKARRRRIPEAVLALGPTPLGVPGLVAGALVFRHKTRKASFWGWVALSAAIGAAAWAATRARA